MARMSREFGGTAIRTLMLPAPDVDAILGLLDDDFALLLTLEVGTKLPLPTGTFCRLPRLHSVVLLRVGDGSYCLVDQSGCRLLSCDAVRSLFDVDEKTAGHALWSDGFLIVGTRRERYPMDVSSMVSYIMQAQHEVLLGVGTDEVRGTGDGRQYSVDERFQKETFDVREPGV
jgi:hypothetical protein